MKTPLLPFGLVLLVIISGASVARAAKTSGKVEIGEDARPEGPSELQKALREWIAKGGDLEKLVNACEDQDLHTAGEAGAVVSALQKAMKEPLEQQLVDVPTLLPLLQNVESERAALVIGKYGLPLVLDWVGERIEKEDFPEDSAHDVLFGLKILAAYQDADGLELLIQAASKGMATDSYMWGVVLDEFDDENSLTDVMLEKLSHPLPSPEIAASLLGVANQAMLKNVVDRHPFESPEGAQLLKKWLQSTDEEDFGKAYDATVAAAFLKGDYHKELLELGSAHPDGDIRLEANWARIKTGDQSGLPGLVKCALDPELSATACEYLKELELEDKIPPAAREPEFAAMAEMIQWLKHPSEIGAPPKSIELYDARDIYWPPLKKKTKLWLFRFSYKFPNEAPTKPIRTSYGLVGGCGTWSFFDEEKNGEKLSAESLYLKHCVLEMDKTGDELPEQEVKRLLSKYNEGMFKE